MATAREYIVSIMGSLVDIAAADDRFCNEFLDELKEIDSTLDSIVSTPHCDECGAIDETVEWCGGCGCCVEHCQLTDLCDDYATEMLELRQIGN